MTFIEELKQLSETAELQHKLDRQLNEVKTKMKAAARSGLRCFKIEIFTLNMAAEAIYLPDTKLENYYSFYTVDEAFYVRAITTFLAELGFDPAEVDFKKGATASYKSVLLTVTW
jgi:hypothetical protein